MHFENPDDYPINNYAVNQELISVDEAIDIANDANTYTQFIPGIRYLDERLAYDWLQINPNIRAQYPVLDSFYLVHFETELEQLRLVDSIINLLGDSIILADTSLYEAIWNAASSANNEIPSGNIFAENEQWINTQYLNVLKNGIESLDELNITDIINLATDCPYIKGNGVFKARMLHAYFEPAYHYDDIGVCNSQGVYRGTSNSLLDEENLIYGNNSITSAKPIIFPNPTTGQITIDYLLQETDQGKVKINDILGNEIFEIHLNNQVRYTTTQLPPLSKGLYLASIIVNGIVVQNIKLVLK